MKAHTTFLGIGIASAMSLANAASADTLSLTHSVYLGGMYMGSFQTEVTQSEKDYSIAATASSNDALDWFFSWKARSLSEGNLEGLTPRPRTHFYDSKWKDEMRGAKITFAPGEVPDYKVIGKRSSNPNKYTPLNKEALRGALDPLSMLVAASLKMEKDGTCNSRYPVFDGRRHLTVKLDDIKSKLFNKSSYNVFAGEAKGCRITYEELGGFKKDSGFELEDDLDIYMASPVPGGRIVPVRMHVDTKLGGFELHLEKYKYQDVKLASRNAR
jgi:hypothetical protein